jgi:hypothetical protein
MSRKLIVRLFSIITCCFLLLGLIGCTGKDLVITNLFNEGLLAVEKNNTWGYITTSGKVEIDFFYDAAGAFNDGIAVVVQNSRYFLINKNGERILDDTYDYLEIDTETGLVWFNVDGAQGLMNGKGAILSDPIYDLIYGASSSCYFTDGLAVVAVDDKYGFIDATGELTIPKNYDYASDFSQGLAVVKIGDKYGYIDKKGNVAIDTIYYNAYSFNAFKQAIVSTYNETTSTETFKVIDKNGDEVFGGYEDINESSFGYVGTLNDLYYLIDTNGEKVDNIGYDDFMTFFDYAMVYIEATDQTIIIDDKYDTIAEFSEAEFPDDAFVDLGVLYFETDKDGFVELKYGSKTATLTCDSVDSIVNGKIIAIRYGMCGVLDLKNKKLLEFNYDDIQIYDDGYWLVSINGFYGIVNEKGNTIVPIEYTACNPSINV